MDTPPPLLVVEDDELVRAFLSRALAGLAGDVDAVATGAEATAAAQRRRYGVILLDGLLPDTHGVDLGRRLVNSPNAARSGICFVSGSLRRAQPMRSGVSALPKPLRLRELTDAVSELLRWRRSAGTLLVDRLAALDHLAADLLVG